MVWSQHMNTDQEDLHLCSGLCVLSAAGLTGRETIWTPAGCNCLLCPFLLSCIWRRGKEERKRFSSAASHKILILSRLPYRLVSLCYKLIKAIYYYPSEWAFNLSEQTVCTCSDSNCAGMQCRAKLQASVSSMKLAAMVQQAVSEMQLVALLSLPILNFPESTSGHQCFLLTNTFWLLFAEDSKKEPRAKLKAMWWGSNQMRRRPWP